MLRQMKKQDYLLIAGILLAALLVFLFFGRKASGKAGAVRVQIGDEVYAVYPLDQDREELLAGYDGGENLLVIKGGEAWISQADCPDRLCVSQGRISKKGQMILCLPHRIILTVISGEEEMDGISG